MALIVTPTRGMKDFLPDEVVKREQVKKVILDTYSSFGFKPVETPAVEHLHLLNNGEGGENEKLIFKILKRGEKLKDGLSDNESLSDSALRYDLTVPLSRFYANNKGILPKPFKVIQIGPVWRAERPQKGRLRQFIQCDIDVLGNEGIEAEIDLLTASGTALRNLGFNDFSMNFNDRRVLYAMADFCGYDKDEYNSFFITLDKLDKIGVEGVLKELSSNSFSEAKVFKTEELIKYLVREEVEITKLNEILEGKISEEIIYNLNLLKDTLSELGYSCIFDPILVRGMSYYTGTIFEFKYKNYPGSIGGGGRYDKMIEKMVGESIPACGFSIGFERIINIMEEESRVIGKDIRNLALLYDNNKLSDVYKVLYKLVENEYNVSVLKKGKKLGKQLKSLKDQGFSYYMIFGEEGIKEMI
ncbi:MAG: histidine--tRNA ligase [Candidatus Delongbacteria bacterium]|nr:histidine--tRNA ligase [Candidatus Delongbacteria bacterium]MBN2833412.1 histidine--tRNA ligase [Candidatus Delongbacteria bacterium]